jgi:hypothetical protein
MKKTKFITIVKWGALLGAGLSVINLLGFFALQTGYHFGPVKDLLQVLAIVGCLYMAIRDIRDNVQDGLIKFQKAFGIGCCIVFIGYLILAIYMLLHLSVIDKNGVENINQRNIEAATKAVQQDTITTVELKQYHSDLKRIARKELNTMAVPDSLRLKADSGVVAILQRYEKELTVLCRHDSALLRLDTFDIRADQQLRSTLFSMRSSNPEITNYSLEAVENARDSMAENPVWLQRRNNRPLPQYHSVSAAAFITTIAVLLYGLMINIFVALFLYRKEKTVCSRNGNDPMSEGYTPEESTEPETTESGSEENTVEEK